MRIEILPRVLALGCAGLMVTSCGVGAPQVSASEDGSDGTATIQAKGQELVNRIRGTAKERAAAQYVVSQVLNEPIQACMERAGYSWNPPELHHGSPAVIEAFGDSIWMREPNRPIVSQQLVLSGRAARDRVAGLEVKYDQEEEAALHGCEDSASKSLDVSDESLYQYDFPAVAAKLSGAFKEMYRSVDAKVAPAHLYTSCMAERGTETTVDVLDIPDPGYAGVRVRLQRSLDSTPAEVPLGDEQPTSAWTRFQAAERETLKDDASCRQGRYEEAMRLVAPQLNSFEQTHEAELNEADQYWRDILGRAEKAGFSSKYLPEG